MACAGREKVKGGQLPCGGKYKEIEGPRWHVMAGGQLRRGEDGVSGPSKGDRGPTSLGGPTSPGGGSYWGMPDVRSTSLQAVLSRYPLLPLRSFFCFLPRIACMWCSPFPRDPWERDTEPEWGKEKVRC